MEYRPLGDSALSVSAFGLGTMMFGAWGNPDPASCRLMVDIALDGGITFFDTADIYDAGRAEEILGEALAGRRDGIVLATKVGKPMGDDPAQRGLGGRWIRQAVEGSLRRLRTDRIDLYQMHWPDRGTPLEETLGALDRLVRAGKVLHVGTSTFPAEQLVEAQWIAGRGFARPVAEQPPYSILARGVERAVLPTCLRYRMGALAWAPLNGGWLTGKYAFGAPRASRGDREPAHFDHAGPMRDRKLDLVGRLQEIAAGAGLPLSALALGFTLTHPAVAAVLIGPRTPEQLEQLLKEADARLDDATLDLIDTVVPPGVDVNPADAGWISPGLDVAQRRRR